MKTTYLQWIAGFVLGVQCGIGVALGATPQYIAAALSNPSRPSADRLRDPARKPDVCLALAGIKPGDRIADVYPGGGYYSRLFSIVVGPQGRVYAIVPEVLAARTPLLPAYTRSQFGDPRYRNVEVLVTPLDALQVPEALDIVWMGQVYHDMPNVEMGPANIAAMNRSIYRALKPGGIYVVTDHAAAPGSGFLDLDPDMSKRIHRIDPAIVRQQVLAAGFVLEADQAFLANPADPHTASVFDASIQGHTDQFFLVFRKPP
jgi:predicted methyltransferase